jgi:UDP-N-acetylmuramate dehydrogenase
MLNIQSNIKLADFTTFKVGGPADYFIVVNQSEETLEALRWAHEQQLRVFVLGGGSNVVFPDEGYRGLVIKLNYKQLTINNEQITVGAGFSLADLITETLKAGLVGLEFAAGIPGSVGGAVVGNAGTYGQDMHDVLDYINYIDIDELKAKHMNTTDGDFAYRHSTFKEHNYVVTEVALSLKKGDTEASQKLIDERLALRHAKHPTEPSAGCIFKNILMDQVDTAKLIAHGLDLKPFEVHNKIPAGFLIDNLDLKGKTIGGAQVSPKHANYIINLGTATAADINTLASVIKQQVRDTYGIQLQEEVRFVYN